MPLFFDADDTLWQNSILFEAVIDDFTARLGRDDLTPAALRAHLNTVEAAIIRRHGYGARSFSRVLAAAWRQLASPEKRSQPLPLDSWTKAIADAPIELLPGVVETLATLAARQRLWLLTKGDPIEQRAKVRRSGLETFFAGVEVVREKDAAVYRRLAAQFRFDPAVVWMIGNSPRSDINPALAAGWHAAHIPHASTWELEDEPLRAPGPGRLLRLQRFDELSSHF